MAAPIPGGGSLVFSGSCERQSAVRHPSSHPKSRSSVVGAQEPALRLRVRPPSASCQACTTSSCISDGGHQKGRTTNSSSQLRGGPTGNSDVRRNANGGNEASSMSSKDASQPQQHSDRPSGHGVPAAKSEAVGTVVICGWLGSNKRYLKKYHDWWTENGYGHKQLRAVWLWTLTRL